MKKYLVPLMSVAMILSTAAVSMAAATVSGDFRYDMEINNKAKDTASSDLRVTVAGNLSEKVSASATFQAVAKDESELTEDNKNQDRLKINEWFVNYKETWGTVKGGYFEHKFTPSRVLLKSADYAVWQKVKSSALVDVQIPIVEGLTVGAQVQPYDDTTNNYASSGAYGVNVGYTDASWGVLASYANFKDHKNLKALDVYYMLDEDMKVFVNAVDYDNGTGKNKYGYDGFDPVVGFAWSNIAGSKLFASVEYATQARYKNVSADKFNEYAVNIKYKFTNAVGLEIEHTVPGKDKNKEVVRLRYQF